MALEASRFFSCLSKEREKDGEGEGESSNIGGTVFNYWKPDMYISETLMTTCAMRRESQ